jgi:hypothetical protein
VLLLRRKTNKKIHYLIMLQLGNYVFINFNFFQLVQYFGDGFELFTMIMVTINIIFVFITKLLD